MFLGGGDGGFMCTLLTSFRSFSSLSVMLRMQLRMIIFRRVVPNNPQDTGHLQGTVRVSVCLVDISVLKKFLYVFFPAYIILC